MTSATGRPACEHSGLAEDLRAVALQLLDRLQPAVERLRAEDGAGPAAAVGTAASCAVCPVCAVIAALRGERPELVARLAEHTSGLLTVLRTALGEGAGAGAGVPCEAGPDPAPAPRRSVQHITVQRG
ncbi:hypothetical protein ACFQE5_04120 [Pseudonocardia hispaniensis]|uniref:Uncharacterized protein n=1 Tax=Pseudonocardia hispaniensis TaxID=904933 RepID=A0ABW1IYV3_9PSEU